MTTTPIGDSLLSDESTPLGEQIIEILDGLTPDGDFKASEVTDEALVWMEINEPDLLEAWSREVSRQTLNAYFRQRLRSRRGSWARSARGRLFREAANGAMETGDLSSLAPFSLSYVVNAESLRRRVADMTTED